MSIHDIRPERNVTVVTMALGMQTLAVPAELLREILDPLPVTRVPGAGPAVSGPSSSTVPASSSPGTKGRAGFS